MAKVHPKKSKLTPRKQPKQERSRGMVETILQATARILVKGDFSELNTNRIAEEAGISVGSLYQYFPTKEATVAALIEKHIESEIPKMREKILIAAKNENKKIALREFFEFLVSLYGKNKKLRMALIDQFPRIGKQKEIQALENEIAHLMFEKIILPARAQGQSTPFTATQLELKEFVFGKSLVAILRSAVLEHQSYLDQTELVSELCDLFYDWSVGKQVSHK